VGIDVGGTNIKFGLVNSQGKIVKQRHLRTRKYGRDKAKLIKGLIESVRLLLRQSKIKHAKVSGIGIGLPGLIDPIKGIVHFLPNIPGWRNVPLKKIFEKELHIKTFLENDVKLITLAEWKFGAGQGVKNLVCITLGTGVGSGLILNNRLYRGERFVAGEIGHIPLNEKGPNCGCGGYGCFERYVGNRYILKKAEKIFRKPHIDFPDIRRLSKKRDKRISLFWKEMATHIGNGLVGVVNLLNPALIIIGGGVSNNHRFLFPTIRKVIRRRAMPVQASMVKIVRAKLGDKAGIIGANVLIHHATQSK